MAVVIGIAFWFGHCRRVERMLKLVVELMGLKKVKRIVVVPFVSLNCFLRFGEKDALNVMMMMKKWVSGTEFFVWNAGG
jgi:hypothetical protein